MFPRNSRLIVMAVVITTAACFVGVYASAVSPTSVEQGRQLFERNWTAGNPTLGNDGLGPLFNGQGCLTCHNQAGVGGGGDAEFNAHTVGIEKMQIVGGPVDDDVLKRMLRTFHPGFIQANGTVINTLALSHHGGTPKFAQARKAFLSQLPAEFSHSGGPTSADEVRFATTTPVLFNNKVGNYQMSLRARLFQRNTTALYGAGLVDQIPDTLIEAQVKIQEKHAEVSGRPSTLRDGRFGKFGWRANVASLVEFTDQACANEVGLETRRKPQASDPMNPEYRNPGIDVTDQQIESMRDFIAALPVPIRDIPSDSSLRMEAERGERLFASVGCAVCHVPDMGPAKGVYSDILLHDMGYELIDLNHAEPYIVRMTPATSISLVTRTDKVSGSGMAMAQGYYGPATEISVDDLDLTTTTSGNSGNSRRRSRSSPRRGNGYEFIAPGVPLRKIQLVDISYKEFTTRRTFKTSNYKTSKYAGIYDADLTVEREQKVRATNYVRVHFQPTNFNQEWRTPPLWGVRDSAPYMHDGRAGTLLESISMHDGESAGTRDRFLALPLADRHAVIAFLETLVAPPNVPKPAL